MGLVGVAEGGGGYPDITMNSRQPTSLGTESMRDAASGQVFPGLTPPRGPSIKSESMSDAASTEVLPEPTRPRTVNEVSSSSGSPSVKSEAPSVKSEPWDLPIGPMAGNTAAGFYNPIYAPLPGSSIGSSPGSPLYLGGSAPFFPAAVATPIRTGAPQPGSSIPSSPASITSPYRPLS